VNVGFERSVTCRAEELESIAFLNFKRRMFYAGIIPNLRMEQEQAGFLLLVPHFEYQMVPYTDMCKAFGTEKVIHA
jgi:hypothetical protein